MEGLDDRVLLSTTAPDLAVLKAGTADSHGVTVQYEVKGADLTRPILFGVYRSADAVLDATDSEVGRVVAPATDTAGASTTAAGTHEVTLTLPNGLPPVPSKPYVLVTADPLKNVEEADESNNTAAFRKAVLGVIVHGGVQPEEWRQGPPWEHRMARDLQEQGYDRVIAFNWVAASNEAGSAARQGLRLAAEVTEAIAAMPADTPVDVHLIGHSEGAVVNSQAMIKLDEDGWPEAAREGYLKVTMLDPHAANNGVTGQQYSVSNGLLGFIARQMINDFQYRAKDPVPIVGPSVDGAEVFFQRTPVSQTFGSNDGVYNLWGQVPVHGPADHYNITAPGISHSGKFGVQDWYRLNVVPTLGTGETDVARATLRADSVDVAGVTAGHPAHYVGRAAPGATVSLLAAEGDAPELMRVGSARAAADGTWQLTTQRLPAGQYRVVAVANDPPRRGHRPTPMKPTAWLDPLIVSPAGIQS